jgi:TonB-linked SusC/RagA family outer membrane protein
MKQMDKFCRTDLKGLCVRFLVLCALSLLTTAGFAQTKTVTGTVTDTGGAPVAGVNVFLPGTSIGTITNGSGEFSLAGVPESASLTFSFLGFVEQQVAVAGRTSLAITLANDSEMLEDVVVIGYGTQKRANAVGSIAQISATQIAERPIPRIENALQGQMSGVSVRSTTGKPGADVQINVRGAASITGESTPLYVVDGVPVSSLQSINPNDIESINVLKDAASAAIYGSRGSNGVVLITTKRGKKGEPLIQLSAYYGVQNLERKIDVLDSEEWITFNKKWLDAQWEKRTDREGYGDSQEERIRLATAKQPLDLNGKPVGSVAYRAELAKGRTTFGIYDPYWGTDKIEPIDWQDAVYETAPISDIQLNISGATDRTDYLISGGVFSQDGILPGTSFKRYSGRVNVNTQVNDWIKVGVTVNPTYGLSYGAEAEGNGGVVATILSIPGWVPAGGGKYANSDPRHRDPSLVLPEYAAGNTDYNELIWKYKNYDQWGAGNAVSPYIMMTGPYRREDNMRLNTSANVLLTLAPGLTVDGMFSWNFRNAQDRSYRPAWMAAGWNSAATDGANVISSYRTWRSNNNLAQVVANYNKVWGDHALDLMAGASQETFGENTSRQEQSNMPNSKTWIFVNGTGKTVNYNDINYSANAMVSYFGRANYTFKDRYILTASFRRDGSSKFGLLNRWGNFPSISAAWKFTDEPFVRNAGLYWLGASKLRVSWGLAGNDRIANASYLASMRARNYVFGGAVANGYATDKIANSYLGWEQTASTNIGLDLSLLNGRVNFSMDYYTKKTSDLLLNSPVSPITGFTSMMDNVGSVKNWGMEFDLTSYNVTTANFRWTTNMNIYFNRNEITALNAQGADMVDGNTISARIQRIGEPINSYYLLVAEGVLRESDFEADKKTPKKGVAIMSGQVPGNIKYKDVNGDGIITTAGDKTITGNYQPDFEWGMTNDFTYKNWELSIFMNGRQGGDLLSLGSRAWNRSTNAPNYSYMSRWLYNSYWSEEEPGDGVTPGFFSNDGNGSTNWLYDATYIRLKNIRLGYNWNVDSKYIKNVRFYVSCDNVYLWDNFSPGYSPEGGTIDGGNSDWGSYPLTRTIIGGINITF